MAKRKQKSGTAPEDWQARIKASPARTIAGHWTTRELAELVGISTTAILMHVHRGRIKAIKQGQPQTHFFTDAEVERFLTRRRRAGRLPGNWGNVVDAED